MSFLLIKTSLLLSGATPGPPWLPDIPYSSVSLRPRTGGGAAHWLASSALAHLRSPPPDTWRRPTDGWPDSARRNVKSPQEIAPEKQTASAFQVSRAGVPLPATATRVSASRLPS